MNMNQEQDRSLLNTLFKFKPYSKLYQFLSSKGGFIKTLCTLKEILTILKDEIRQEKLYDEKNPSIVLCSAQLEEALDMKAFHVTEIRDLVLKQLIRIDNDYVHSRYFRELGHPNPDNFSNNLSPVSAEAQCLIRTANISTNVVINKEATFTCKPKFLLVLRTLQNMDKNKTVFTYEEILKLVSTYILTHREKFFDKRNLKLAIVKNDILGDAFDLSAFHRCQLVNLIRTQIIPTNPGTVKTVVTSSGTTGCMVTIREMPAAQTHVSGYLN